MIENVNSFFIFFTIFISINLHNVSFHFALQRKRAFWISSFYMPQTGIEPVREYKSRRILSPVRLPVPPLRHFDNLIGYRWGLQGSNLWPSACKADALPAELRPQNYDLSLGLWQIQRPGWDSNPRPPPWQGGALTNWATGPNRFMIKLHCT